ncbi:zinc finger, GRF-type [Artemisia annua]|uniref:Zinc finger, GRF-type n=1 Tax=Artemisia annua TaxID=35608 RepID=A0A2U1M5I2_ARTAN|nr:zinc finger, GRF-type [Artemisia annua]
MVCCWCGRQTIVHTSFTAINPWRRFYACPDQASDCRFLGWYHPQMCACSTMIIQGLLRPRNELEAHKLLKSTCESERFTVCSVGSCF